MTAFRRRYMIPTLILAALAPLAYVSLKGSVNGTENSAEMSAAEVSDDALQSNPQSSAVLDRIARKGTIVASLIDGRITLREAAARFREMSDTDGIGMEQLRRMYPALSDHELFCRNVIDFATTNLDLRPDITAVLAQLEKEFEQIVLSSGRRRG